MPIPETVFKARPLAGRSLLQRLFKQPPPENAVIELNNLLASVELGSIQLSAIRAIEQAYEVDLLRDFHFNLEEFYAVLWNQYLKADPAVTVTIADLDHLVELLGISPDTVVFLHNKIGEIWFKEAVGGRLKNRRLSPEDKAYLNYLPERLQLDRSMAEKIIKAAKLQVVSAYWSAITKKNNCSPQEEQEVREMIQNLELPADEVKSIMGRLQTLRYYWNLANLSLQPVQTSVAIQKSEVCYLEIQQVKWLETRKMNNGYSHLEQVNFGKVCLTNKRLVFEGRLKNSTIPYDRVRGVSVEAEGVLIGKDKGKDPVLAFSGDKEVFRIVMKRLVHHG